MKLNKVNIENAKNIIKRSIRHAFANDEILPNIMLTGSPGVGKSSIVLQAVREVEDELNIEIVLFDVRLGSYEASEVQGVPHNVDTGVTYLNEQGYEIQVKELTTSTPDWFPRDKEKYYVIFFDEFTNCPVSVQHAAYRILLDRSIQNGTKLPTRCAIIAAGNLRSDKTGTKPLMPAAANRFGIHMEIDNSTLSESFVSYALSKGLDRTIVGFLQWKPDSIFNGIGVEDAFASPRTWEVVNKHIEVYGDDPELFDIAVAGAIGTEDAIAYLGYREFDGLLPDLKQVRKGEIDYSFPIGEEQIKWAALTGISYEVIDILSGDPEDEALQIEMNNMVALVNQIPKEMQIVFFRMINNDPSKVAKIFKFPSFRESFKTISTFVSSMKR